MAIQLNGELLGTLIEATGGVDAFLDRWSAAGADGSDGLDQATAYRWMNGQLPKNSKRLLRLCAVMEVDPFALLAAPDGNIADAAEELLEFYQTRRPVHAALRFLRDFFGRQKEWPPQSIATDYFSRPWHNQEFTHDPGIRSNYYRRIELLSDMETEAKRPQVFHFAFRHPRMFGERWLQYGTVMRLGLKASLWHINGHTHEIMLSSFADPTPVMTWLGAGAAIFRVASLHAFSLVTAPTEEDDSPALVFPA